MNCRVSLRHCRVSLRHCRVSLRHCRVSLWHCRVSQRHCRVSLRHCRVRWRAPRDVELRTLTLVSKHIQLVKIYVKLCNITLIYSMRYSLKAVTALQDLFKLLGTYW